MKNKFAVNSMRLMMLVLAVFSLAFQSDCQKADVSPYVKYQSDSDVPRISIEDAKKDYDSGTAVIIDSRAEVAYKQEHIKGALNVPFGAPDNQAFSKIPKGKKIIVYCSWPSEHTSAGLALQLNQKEIPGTYALVGGTMAWKNAGYPMESSEKTDPPAVEQDNPK